MVRSRPTGPTVADVALAAGVSKATASRVLGGYGSATSQTKQRVLNAAERMGYRANGFARGMNTGRSNTIGVIHEGIENPIFAVAIRGMSDVAEKHGFSVILANTGTRVDREVEAVDKMLERRVDGLIVCPVSHTQTDHLVRLAGEDFPLVLWERRAAGLPVPVIEADQVATSTQLAHRLNQLGHRRIGYISTAPVPGGRYKVGDSLDASNVDDRLKAIYGAQLAVGAESSADLVRFVPLGDESRMEAAVRELFADRLPPTALIASDSEIALSVLTILAELSLAVPADVSVVTYDDVRWAKVSQPPLTVIAQPTYDMGRKTAELLIQQVKTGTATAGVTFPTQLIWRDSVAGVDSEPETTQRSRQLPPASSQQDASPTVVSSASADFLPGSSG